MLFTFWPHETKTTPNNQLARPGDCKTSEKDVLKWEVATESDISRLQKKQRLEDSKKGIEVDIVKPHPRPMTTSFWTVP